jgi:hypothetical protein
LRIAAARDLETIDSELRLIAAVRRVCREYGGRLPSMTVVDELWWPPDLEWKPDDGPARTPHFRQKVGIRRSPQ